MALANEPTMDAGPTESDEELIHASQQMESSYVAAFSDISDDEFVAASQLIESSWLQFCQDDRSAAASVPQSAVGQNISDLVADVPEDSGTGRFREPQTLRQIIISLQKFMEIQGRMERFLSDDKYKVSVV